LARYFSKHIACRMSESGFAVPSSFVAFLNGAGLMSDVQMVLFKDKSLRRRQTAFRREASIRPRAIHFVISGRPPVAPETVAS